MEQSGLGYKITEKKGGGGEWEGMWTWSTCGSVQGSGYRTAGKKKKSGEGKWEGMWTRSTCGSVQGSGYKTPEEKRW